LRALAALVIAGAVLSGGCRGTPTVSPVAARPVPGLSEARYFESLLARCDPPLGWSPEPLKQSGRHTHQVWLSPSKQTAYGVIHFSLPLPVSTDLALWGFLREMKRSEGGSQLLEKQWDANLDGLRFVAEGGLYTIRANLLVRGFDGWAIYAGTLRDGELIPDEIALAVAAREHTEVGKLTRTDR
jgi:hypothetical protein